VIADGDADPQDDDVQRAEVPAQAVRLELGRRERLLDRLAGSEERADAGQGGRVPVAATG
jgi:hypothetical protein